MDEATKQQIMAGDYTPVGYSPKCPNCESRKTYYSCLCSNWLCLNCGIEFSPEDATPYYDVQAYKQDERIAEENLIYKED